MEKEDILRREKGELNEIQNLKKIEFSIKDIYVVYIHDESYYIQGNFDIKNIETNIILKNVTAFRCYACKDFLLKLNNFFPTNYFDTDTLINTDNIIKESDNINWFTGKFYGIDIFFNDEYDYKIKKKYIKQYKIFKNIQGF